MKTLLIISGNDEAVPGILAAKKMGCKVVVSDMDPRAPAFDYADFKIICSTYDIKKTVELANQFHRNIKKIDGVMCIASDVSLTVAHVAKSLRLPGISVRSAEKATNKLLMKNTFHRDNVSVPRFKFLNNFHDFLCVKKDWGLPLVLKPIDNRGSRGVLLISEKVDLDWAWNYSLSFTSSSGLLVEEFLDGPQVSTESLVINGECFTIGISDRNYEYMNKYTPHIIENGGDLPSSLDLNVVKEIKDLVFSASESLGIKNGVVKGDIVVSKGKVYVIELAARLSGGFFCTHQIPLSTGVDFLKQAIKLSLGQQINYSSLKTLKNNYISQRYLLPKPGIIRSINGFEKLKNNPNVKHFILRAKTGQEIEHPKAHPQRIGMVIAQGNSRKNAIKNATDALNDLEIIY
jgi:biotin carboxylase